MGIHIESVHSIFLDTPKIQVSTTLQILIEKIWSSL